MEISKELKQSLQGHLGKFVNTAKTSCWHFCLVWVRGITRARRLFVSSSVVCANSRGEQTLYFVGPNKVDHHHDPPAKSPYTLLSLEGLRSLKLTPSNDGLMWYDAKIAFQIAVLLFCLKIVPANFCKLAKDNFHTKFRPTIFTQDKSQILHEMA